MTLSFLITLSFHSLKSTWAPHHLFGLLFQVNVRDVHVFKFNYLIVYFLSLVICLYIHVNLDEESVIKPKTENVKLITSTIYSPAWHRQYALNWINVFPITSIFFNVCIRIPRFHSLLVFLLKRWISTISSTPSIP